MVGVELLGLEVIAMGLSGQYCFCSFTLSCTHTRLIVLMNSSNLTFSLAPNWEFVPTEDWRADLVGDWIREGWVSDEDEGGTQTTRSVLGADESRLRSFGHTSPVLLCGVIFF